MTVPPPRPAVRRSILRSTALVAINVVAIVAAIALLFDWNWLKGPLERHAKKETGRELVIAGDIVAESLFPLRVTLRGVRFANPDWAQQPLMLDAEQITVGVPLLALLRRPLVLESLAVQGATVALEAGPDGRRSWRLDKAQSDRNATIGFRRIVIERGIVSYLDREQDTDLAAKIGSRSEGTTRIEIAGRARATPLAVTVTTVSAAEALDAASAVAAPSPLLRGKGRIGDAAVSFEGRLGPGYALAGTQFDLLASGPDLAGWRRLARAAVPATPPYRIDARVAIGAGQVAVTMKPSAFGDSRLQGELTIDTAGARPQVEARLSADPLDLDDLGPLIGAAPGVKAGETASEAQRALAAKAAARGRVLPAAQFDTRLWPAVDMDIRLDARKVVDAGRSAIDAFSFRARLADGNLDISPLSVSMAGGTVDGGLSLGRLPKGLAMQAKLGFRKLQLARLLPASERVAGSVGTISGALELSGAGSSLDRVLATSNGRLALAMGPGEISNLLLELVGLDGGEALRFLLGGDRQSKLRCAVASMPIDSGTLRAEAVVFDTDDTHIVMTGSADLARETLDFTLHPRPKDWSLFSARSPIHLRGSFMAPKVSADAGSLAARAAAVLLLSLVNPLAALIPLIETGGGEDAPCRELLASVRGAAAKAAPRN